MDLALPPMPFSAIHTPSPNNSWLPIPVEFRVPSDVYDESTHLQLPAGVVQVIVTWRGTEALLVRHYRGTKAETVATIPAASSPTIRSTGVLTLSSEDVHALLITNATGTGDSWSQDTFDKRYVVGVQVMPMGTAADITGGGSLLRVDNSVGTRVFLGDTMIHGDTGRRNVTEDALADGVNGSLHLWRIGPLVNVTWNVNVDPGWVAGATGAQFPAGFRSIAGLYWPRAYDVNGLNVHSGNNGIIQFFGSSSTDKRYFRGFYTFTTKDAWPTSLPGTPA